MKSMRRSSLRITCQSQVDCVQFPLSTFTYCLPPMINIAFMNATADGIAALLFPDLEAVVHDLRSGQIAHIANGFSRRKVGDASLITDLPELDKGLDVIGPYEKAAPNNRVLRSISIAARGPDGRVAALLCLNFDVTVLTQVQKLLSGYVVGVQPQARPAPLFRTDWREQLNAIVQAISVKQNVRQSEFGRTEIMLTLAHARAAGLLDIRNFIDYFSEYFDISRATVYNYLKATPKE
ncbi:MULTISPECIES: transcriptional regulator [Pseudomonas]|nr:MULTISPECIES: PAS domain-containing protein [Pseudomonas]